MNDEFPYYYECQVCGGVAKRMRRKMMKYEVVKAEDFEGVNRGDGILCDKCGSIAHYGCLNPMIEHIKPFINEIYVNVPSTPRKMVPCYHCKTTGSSEIKLSFGGQSYVFPSVCSVCSGSGEIPAIEVTVLKSRNSNNGEIDLGVFYDNSKKVGGDFTMKLEMDKL